MSSFDMQTFKEALESFRDLKAKNTPYDGEKWKTNSSKKNSLADQCTKILDSIKKTLADVSAEWGMADTEIYVSKGAGYFPKVPWIGILFKGEKPVDGVYPVFWLYEDGLTIACVESFTRPQVDFPRSCDLSKGTDPGARHTSVHMAKGSVTWIPYDGLAKQTASSIEKAVRKAIGVRRAYRDKFPVEKLAVEKSPCSTVEPVKEVSTWFTVKEMDDVGKWLSEVCKKKGGMWVFRGQADSAWVLETGLGRKCFLDAEEGNPELDLGNILEAERSMMDEFHREIARRIEYKSFRNVELLALMQHYESKTRLLDFSFSPLVALHFALESYDGYMGHVRAFQKTHKDGEDKSEGEKVEAISVWAVDVERIACPTKQEGDTLRGGHGGRNLRKGNPGKSFRERLELFHEEADAILNVAASKGVKAGIDVVIPSVNNDRSSAQEGLFLMPRRMDRSFESNLLSSIAANRKTGDDGCCIRYDFPVSIIEKIRDYLQTYRMTAKQIYPDLTGLAKSLNAKVDFKGKE